MRIRGIIFGLLIPVFFLLNTDFSYAQVQSQFLITTRVLGDSTPPTTPLNLRAINILTTQIDLAWDSSVDDSYIIGYELYRNGQFLALLGSTTIAHSDTGLTPNTTYTYTVQAIDAVENRSASSTPLVVKTNSLPHTSGGGGTYINTFIDNSQRVIEITDFNIIPSHTSAYIVFKTNIPIRTITKWGETTDNEIGTSYSNYLSRIHFISLENLSEGTKYHFNISLIDEYNKNLKEISTYFLTTSVAKEIYLPNVSNLNAEAIRSGVFSDVKIKWEYPEVPNEGVVVLRTVGHYPIDKFDGKIVYDGTQNNFTDRVDVESKYFYTVFVKYKKDKNSSGSVIRQPNVKDVELEKNTNKNFLDFSKIIIEQIGQKIRPINKVFSVASEFPVTLAIEKNDLLKDIKIIVLKIVPDNENNTQSTYLLTYNFDKIRYESSFNLNPGIDYSFSIYYIDSLGKVRGENKGYFKVKEVISQFNRGDLGWYGIFIDFLWLLILIIILLVLYFIYRLTRKNQKREETTLPKDQNDRIARSIKQ